MTQSSLESGFVTRPDYRVDLLARRNEVTARIGDTLVARSQRTILVDEQDHGLVFYFPRADVLVDLVLDPDRTSRCPYKGQATYWRIEGVDGAADEPVTWSYDEPYEQVARIAGHVAFYQDRVAVTIGAAVPAVLGYEGKR